jgi:hypothetical protein
MSLEAHRRWFRSKRLEIFDAKGSTFYTRPSI